MDPANEYPDVVNKYCNWLKENDSSFWQWLQVDGPYGRMLDFKQDLWIALSKAQATFNPAKASFDTWAFICFGKPGKHHGTVYGAYKELRATCSRGREVSFDGSASAGEEDEPQPLERVDKNAVDPVQVAAGREFEPIEGMTLTIGKRLLFTQLHRHWRRRRAGEEKPDESIFLSPPQTSDIPLRPEVRSSAFSVWLSRRAWWRLMRL